MKGSNSRSTAPALVSASRKAQTEKAHPAEPVAQVELGPLVAETVLRLQDQDLEHQHVVEGGPATLAALRPRHGPLQLGTEDLEIDHRRQPLQPVALGRQEGQPLLHVEEPRLPRHPVLPRAVIRSNHSRPRGVRFLELSSYGPGQPWPGPGRDL